MKRILDIALSVWLSVLLLFGGTAKEFIHLFAAHEDTVHCRYEHNGLVIEPEHHHCTFLQFSLASFINDISLPAVFITPAGYVIHNSSLHLRSYTESVSAIFLRGPPCTFV